MNLRSHGALSAVALLAAVAARSHAQAVADVDSRAARRAVLERRAGLSVRDVPLTSALERLFESSGVVVAFSPSLVSQETRPVSCECRSVTVKEALDRLLNHTPFDYSVVRDQVMVVLGVRALDRGLDPPAATLAGLHRDPNATGRPPTAEARPEPQAAPIAGVVLDQRSRPLAGARVAVVGGNRQVETDASGRFRFDDLTGVSITLRVVVIGFQPLTVEVRVGDTDLRLALTESALNLEEIIVTGTAGGTEKRAIGNAVSKIDAADVVESAPIHDVADILNGRAPGVTVFNGTGVVGGGARIQIRGRTSISLRSEPLIYVDGIRVSNEVATGPNIQTAVISRLNDINPNDIESIEVIKGPAAATLYGTEANNGVIQIITKKGATGRSTFALSVREGANWFMNPEGRVPHSFARGPGGEILEQDLFAQERAAGRPIFRTGHAQAYQLSVNGGRDIIRYYLGAGYDREEGIEPTNDFQRKSGRLNLTVLPAGNLEVTANVGLVQADRNLSQQVGSSVIWGLVFANPLLGATPTRGFNSPPPEAIWSAYRNGQDVHRYTAGVQVNHSPASWFSHRLAVGVDQTGETNRSITELQPDSIAQFLSPFDQQGYRTMDRRDLTTNTFDYGATAHARVSPRLRASTSVGFQYFRTAIASQSSTGIGFPAPGISAISSAAQTLAGGGSLENVTVGVFIQEQLALNDRLFLTAALRADDNSAFGEDFDLVKYPKVGLSWVVSEEPFWKVGFVDALKLRAAYGHSGQQPRNLAALRTFQPTTGEGGSTVTPLALGNPSLAPERGEELELGLEAALFGERIGLDVSYYNKRTENAILLRDVAPSTGFPGRQFVNAGVITNKGIEAAVRVVPIQARSATWQLDLNLGTNANKIVDLDPAQPDLTFLPLAFGRHAEGYPISGWWRREVVRATFNPTTGQAENVLCNGGPGAAPLPCDEAPVVYLGRPTPKVEGSVINTLTLFGRLRLHAQVDFKTGHRLFDANTLTACGFFLSCEVNVRPEDFDPAYVAEVQTAGSVLNISRFISDASYAKLRELSIGYSVPPRWARSIGAERATITLAGRNLHTWTKYSGLDPEALIPSLIDTPGSDFYLDQANLPQLASFRISVDVTW